jgi:hypothetical protein
MLEDMEHHTGSLNGLAKMVLATVVVGCWIGSAGRGEVETAEKLTE